MRWCQGIVALTVALPLMTGPAAAQSGPKADTVIAFVRKAVAHVDTVGATQAFADFSDIHGAWVSGEFYIFCHTLDGINVAHGGNPGLVGHKVLGFRDPSGVFVNVLIINKVNAEGKGWVQYEWPHPVTHKVATKFVYSEKVLEKFVCGSGYYEG